MTLGFYYNMDACIGCKLCQVVCKDKNDLDVGTNFRRARSYSVGRYPDARMFHLSMSCNHCEKPACVEHCPTGAMFKSEDGIVLHDDDVCIGCRTCLAACPFDAPAYLADDDIARKCDACSALRDLGEQPACVAACPMRALEFDDMDELAASHPDARRWEGDTNPNLLFSPKPYAFGEDADELVL